MENRMASGKGKANWTELPLDVTASILWRLPAEELLGTAQFVCWTWRDICRDPLWWRHVRMKGCPFRYFYHYGDRHNRLCRLAVDMSCRSLESISICAFATDQLLRYVALGTNNLKHLRLVHCTTITEEGLVSMAPQVPLLEELEFSYCINFWDATAIEAFALNCPSLVSFKLRLKVRGRADNARDVARVIAESMPGLVRLHLHGGYLWNRDLQAILDGCPRLESLDLRLDGDLGVRCAEQIRDWWRPCDPEDDDCSYYSDYADGSMDSCDSDKESDDHDGDHDYYYDDYDDVYHV